MITKIKLQLSREERELILEYGYPFEVLRGQLNALKDSQLSEEVTTDDFYLGNLLADIVRSMKETEHEDLLERLDALYGELEHQAATQDAKIR